MTDDSAEILFQLFSAGGPCEKFWHGQECSLFDALKDGVGEAVLACDMPEPCKFPSLDSCQKSFRLKFCVFDRLKIQII